MKRPKKRIEIENHSSAWYSAKLSVGEDTNNPSIVIEQYQSQYHAKSESTFSFNKADLERVINALQWQLTEMKIDTHKYE